MHEEISINVKVKLSLWSAIKLRIAGMSNVQEMVNNKPKWVKR